MRSDPAKNTTALWTEKAAQNAFDPTRTPTIVKEAAAAEGQPDDPYHCIVKLDSLDVTSTEPLSAYVPRLDLHANREAQAGTAESLGSHQLPLSQAALTGYQGLGFRPVVPD